MDYRPQFPLSMGFSRPEYWNGLPFPSLGDLPDPGIKPMVLRSPALNARSGQKKDVFLNSEKIMIEKDQE